MEDAGAARQAGRRAEGGLGWRSPAPVLFWLLWAALLFGGFALGSAEGDAAHRIPTWARMGSSAALVAAAWTWYALGRATAATRTFALLFAAGMSAGFAGDLVLSGALPGGANVLAGIAAFGVGHVCYIIAILRWADGRALTDARVRWTAFAVWWAVGAAAWYLVVFRGGEASALHWAALPYALLLSGTCGAATGLAVRARAFVPLAVGAALFLASDLILAAQLFNDLEFALIGDVIWLTYGPGQMLIVYANAAVQGAERRDAARRSG